MKEIKILDAYFRYMNSNFNKKECYVIWDGYMADHIWDMWSCMCGNELQKAGQFYVGLDSINKEKLLQRALLIEGVRRGGCAIDKAAWDSSSQIKEQLYAVVTACPHPMEADSALKHHQEQLKKDGATLEDDVCAQLRLLKTLSERIEQLEKLIQNGID